MKEIKHFLVWSARQLVRDFVELVTSHVFKGMMVYIIGGALIGITLANVLGVITGAEEMVDPRWPLYAVITVSWVGFFSIRSLWRQYQSSKDQVFDTLKK